MTVTPADVLYITTSHVPKTRLQIGVMLEPDALNVTVPVGRALIPVPITTALQVVDGTEVVDDTELLSLKLDDGWPFCGLYAVPPVELTMPNFRESICVFVGWRPVVVPPAFAYSCAMNAFAAAVWFA